MGNYERQPAEDRRGDRTALPASCGRLSALLAAWLAMSAACKSASVDGAPAAVGAAPRVQWDLKLEPAGQDAVLHPALLGHYDLSGALFRFDKVPGLPAAMKGAGFAEWRIGAGRWEAATRLLPRLSDDKVCAFPLERAHAPAGTSDLDLIQSRDWFVDDGRPVTLAMTGDDSRYALGYLRRAVEVAAAFEAAPFVSVDLMPRALAANRVPRREHCLWSFTNGVSNSPPADPSVFAAAVEGLVRRLVEGRGDEPGRAVTHFEIWNEPDLPYFWDRRLDPKFRLFFAGAAGALVRLDAYRERSGRRDLRFGLGGFARHEVALEVIRRFDRTPLPNGRHLPLDFISFHAYHNDPMRIVGKIRQVAAAARASRHFKRAEVVLSEWGPHLEKTGGDHEYAASMKPPLLMSTVIALGAAAGLDRSHHAIFWDFYPGAITWGLFDHAVKAKPLAHGYRLLARLIGAGSDRLEAAAAPGGELDGGRGALLAARERATGKVRALLINRGTAQRSVRLRSAAGEPVTPRALHIFDDPARPPRRVRPEEATFTVPPRALVLAEL